MINFNKFLEVKKFLIDKGSIELNIKGTSMIPLISDKDRVKVHPLTKKPLKIFDIIVYWQNNNKFVCHYFWKDKRQTNPHNHKQLVVTRPLNPPGKFDFPVNKDHILGLVTNFKIPVLRKVYIIFQHLRKKGFSS